jgi:serine/threonine protein kinase
MTDDIKTVKPFPYNIIKKVGEGAFGEVFKAKHHKIPGRIVALKCEVANQESKKNRLQIEYGFYRQLNNNKDYKGIPRIYWYGNSTTLIDPSTSKPLTRNIMIMDYLGPCLEKLYDYFKRRFSIKTILMIGLQCIERLEFVHNNGIIHRDIKPENFMIGPCNSTKSIIYIADFGLSKKYIDFDNYTLNPFRVTNSFVGTLRFCSMRSHKNLEQGRRDDLESLGNMLIYLFRGNLPWQGVPEDKTGKKDARSLAIFNIKKTTSLEDLCSNCPTIMVDYMNHCRLLRYTEVPNYTYLKSLFINEISARGYVLDNVFDWHNI